MTEKKVIFEAHATPHPRDKKKWRGVIDRGVRREDDYTPYLGPYQWTRVWRCDHMHELMDTAHRCAVAALPEFPDED